MLVNCVVPFCAGRKEQDLLAEQRKQACLEGAKTATVNCKNAYSTLLRICSTYVGALGGVAISKFLTWVRAEEKGLSTAVTIGAASVGYSESVLSCDTLAPMAMNYCEVGASKLSESCK